MLPLLAVVRLVRWKKQTGTLRYSGYQGKRWSWAALKPHLYWLSWAALGCLFVAFARPRSSEVNAQTRGGEGIDIMLAVDISPSMLALDLRPNRLEALKEVAIDFVEKRPNDRIGLVVYAKEAYTQTPLTTDHDVLVSGLAELESGLLANGTAVGMGLATAVNRIKDSDAKSKVVILMTDGENNSGNIEPMSAAQLARDLGIKVYTIGIGSNGFAKFPAQTINGQRIYQQIEVTLDEALLKNIASETGGTYFRATKNSELGEIYEQIDQLEKSKVEELKFTNYTEHFYPWAIAALLLIASEVLLRNTLFRSAL